MNVLLFGATGMIGQSVLRECLADAGVTGVTVVARRPTGLTHPKLREALHADVTDLRGAGVDPAAFDACFWCLGVSSAGMGEAEYTRITHDLTVKVARQLVAANPRMAFVFVSGVGADPTEKGRTMWARVKGRTENAILAMGFGAAYVLRPAFVLAPEGVRSATGWYNAMYVIARPLYPLVRRLFPTGASTGQEVGRAMLAAVRHGHSAPIIQGAGIHALAAL